MATPLIVIGVLLFFSVGQSDAACMDAFMNCPTMITINPFNVNTTTAAYFTPMCPNITNIYNCYNGTSCLSNDSSSDAFQSTLGTIRSLQALCTSLSGAYASNAVCISNLFNRPMGSPPLAPTTTGPCNSVTVPFGMPSAANMTNTAICASWYQAGQCLSYGITTACGTAAGQFFVDYYSQMYLSYINKYGCGPITVSGGSGGPAGTTSTAGAGGTSKTSAAQGLVAQNLAVFATIACSMLIGWRKMHA